MKIRILIFGIILTVFYSCSKDDDTSSDPIFDGSEQAIERFYNLEFLETIKDFGLQINVGDSPPLVSGIFLSNPSNLTQTNIENDFIQPGHNFGETTFQFANQDTSNLTIDVEVREFNNTSISFESYISGSNDMFTAFLKVESTVSEHTVITAYVVSGKINDNSIENLEWVVLMLDDRGDPNDELIENNRGRYIVDGDNTSPRQ